MSTTLLDILALRIDGQNAAGTYADVVDALTSLTMVETITGASTIEMTLSDPHRVILRSGLLSEGSNVIVKDGVTLSERQQAYGLRGATCTLDGAGFELVAVRKAGTTLSLSWEDMAVAALRRKTGQRVVAAGTMTRAEFCASLIREVPWIKVSYAPGAKSLEQLHRGAATLATAVDGGAGGFPTASASVSPSGDSILLDGDRHAAALPSNVVAGQQILDTQDRQAAAAAAAAVTSSAPGILIAPVTGPALTTAQQKADLEDTWTACGRTMGEIGWRVMARRGGIILAPDSWLMTHSAATYTLGEDSVGVDMIDVDWDVGKPAATATLTVWAGATDLSPGSPVVLKNMGPANGPWLVETINRTVSSKLATVTCVRPNPALTEPVDSSLDGSGIGGQGGFPTSVNGSQVQSLLEPISFNPGSGTSRGEKFVQYALAQRGKAYVGGANGPNTFDCSGLVQAAASAVGVSFPKPVSSQSLEIVNAGLHLSVALAVKTRGAVLYRGTPGVNGGMSGSDHIAISLGNGLTVEARGRAYGVDCFSATSGRDWAGGGIIPGIGPAL